MSDRQDRVRLTACWARSARLLCFTALTAEAVSPPCSARWAERHCSRKVLRSFFFFSVPLLVLTRSSREQKSWNGTDEATDWTLVATAMFY